MAFQQYNLSPWLTPVRLATTSNQAGTYFNGPLNNGVGATLTYATGALSIDSVVVAVGDRVLLAGQTNTNENGIYVCTVAGATGVSAVLQRAADQQCIEQIHAGFYVTVAAGAVNAGGAFVTIESLPALLGISPLLWLSQAAVGTVAFSGGPTAANALAVFSDTAGNLKAQTTTSTLGFGLTAATGDFTATAGNFVATVGYFTRSAVNGLTALAGGAQAGTALTREINRVTTVVTAADSVQLPLATAGRSVVVINAAAANAMAVFPQTGQIINALAANASISVAANKAIMFVCAVTGSWNSILTA